MSATNNGLLVLARLLLSFMFIMAGFFKLVDPAGTAGMISGAGLPAATLLAYAAGIFEFVGVLFILVGFQTKITSWAIALFCVFTAFVFHSAPDMVNQLMMMKNLTIAGGYLALSVVGAGAYSIDARRGSAVAA